MHDSLPDTAAVHAVRRFRCFRPPAFYPTVIVTFDAAAAEPHYHLPLLLNPFGYSTYRGC
jgi:5-hydroxyisourate hydrolase